VCEILDKRKEEEVKKICERYRYGYEFLPNTDEFIIYVKPEDKNKFISSGIITELLYQKLFIIAIEYKRGKLIAYVEPLHYFTEENNFIRALIKQSYI